MPRTVQGVDPSHLEQHLRLAAYAIGGAALLCFTASGPHAYDSGELVAAAWRMGGSHPPGQPLHALLAHALCRLPLGPVVARVGLISVGGAVLAACLAARVVRAQLTLLGVESTRGARVGADAAALALLLSPPLLRQATRPEVYTLALALFLYSAWQSLQWLGTSARGNAALMRAALSAGLAAAVHPPHALAAAAVGLGAALALRRSVFRQPRALSWTCGLGLLGALGAYLYLPLRALAGAPMWGEAAQLGGFVRYVSGAAYGQNLGPGDTNWFTNTIEVLGYAARATGMVPLAGALAAWLLARARPGHARLGAGLALSALLPLTAALLQPHEVQNPDNVAYVAPTVALWICTGTAGLTALALHGGKLRKSAGVGLVLAALNLVQLPRAPARLQADLPALDSLGQALVQAPPPRALVIAETDFSAATWMMEREVAGARPDTALLVPGLVTSSWHWRSLAPHPAYDGQPVRGPGTTPRMQYLHGALGRAHGRVPIAAETTGPESSILAGPYVVDSQSDVYPLEATGERFAHLLGSATKQGPHGDHDVAGAILRNYHAIRAKRLLQRSQPVAALAALEHALWFLPEAQRDLLRLPEQTRAARADTPVVHQPGAFLLTREDSVREASVLLFRLGAAPAAYALLRAQLERGENRALLQLAWFRLVEGDGPAARQALIAFLERFPDGELEATGLLRKLDVR